MICQSQDVQKPRSKTHCDMQNILLLLGKTKGAKKSPWLVNPSDFWKLMSYHKFGYAGDSLGRKDYRVHLRCVPHAVLRTLFREGIIAWDQRHRGMGKQRVEAENTSVLSQMGRSTWNGSHRSCSVPFCTNAVKGVFFFDMVKEKAGSEKI